MFGKNKNENLDLNNGHHQKITFSKVSFNQFLSDSQKLFGINHSMVLVNTKLRNIYDNIKLPKRATSGSMGYDFFTPFNFHINKGEWIVIPTGIRVSMPNDLGLMMLPRSGHGFKYNVTLANTAGIIDSDYFNAKNEGHIMLKIVNNGLENIYFNPSFNEDTMTIRSFKSNIGDATPKHEFECEVGTAIAQGIFLKYYISTDDDVTTVRTGGFGSTSK